jgi:hypothetical protein
MRSSDRPRKRVPRRVQPALRAIPGSLLQGSRAVLWSAGPRRAPQWPPAVRRRGDGALLEETEGLIAGRQPGHKSCIYSYTGVCPALERAASDFFAGATDDVATGFRRFAECLIRSAPKDQHKLRLVFGLGTGRTRYRPENFPARGTKPCFGSYVLTTKQRQTVSARPFPQQL